MEANFTAAVCQSSTLCTVVVDTKYYSEQYCTDRGKYIQVEEASAYKWRQKQTSLLKRGGAYIGRGHINEPVHIIESYPQDACQT